MNNRLYGRRYLAGDAYTIADMISYPWTVGWESQGQGDFTRVATTALVQAFQQGLSNQGFLKLVLQQLGPKARQRPLLLPGAGGLSDRSLLGGP